MKTMMLTAMLVTAGLAGAQGQVMAADGVERTRDGASSTESTGAPAASLRQTRGCGPVVGMPCEDGYKRVGEDCVLEGTEFE